jgi:hypothetical protein
MGFSREILAERRGARLTATRPGRRFEDVLRDDYLMRLVRQLADALARIAGLRKAGLLDQAAQELDAAFASLGGIDPLLARDGDAAFLLSLVQDPSRREALSRLLEERDALRAARGAGR